MITQNRKLLDFKGNPDYILPSLKVIKDHQGNWKLLWTQLVKMLKERGSTAKEDNIVSAIILPTLRNLKLIEGEGENSKLSSDGNQCLLEYEQNGEEGYKKRLGYQIIKIDEENTNLLSHLFLNHNSQKNAVDLMKLKEELYSMGIENAKKSSPVQAWLSLFAYVDMIRKVNGNYHLVSSQLDSLKKGEKKPSTQTFARALQDAARRLKYLAKGSPYIPIPDFREDVCAQLRISSFTFDKMIKEFPPNYNGIRVVFATPIKRVQGGIKVGSKYYYFIAVF